MQTHTQNPSLTRRALIGAGLGIAAAAKPAKTAAAETVRVPTPVARLYRKCRKAYDEAEALNRRYVEAQKLEFAHRPERPEESYLPCKWYSELVSRATREPQPGGGSRHFVTSAAWRDLHDKHETRGIITQDRLADLRHRADVCERHEAEYAEIRAKYRVAEIEADLDAALDRAWDLDVAVVSERARSREDLALQLKVLRDRTDGFTHCGPVVEITAFLETLERVAA